MKRVQFAAILHSGNVRTRQPRQTAVTLSRRSLGAAIYIGYERDVNDCANHGKRNTYEKPVALVHSAPIAFGGYSDEFCLKRQ